MLGVDANEIIDESAVAFMFIEWAHDLDPSVVVADTRMAARDHEIVGECLVVVPTDLLQNQRRAPRQMLDGFHVFLSGCAHTRHYKAPKRTAIKLKQTGLHE